MRCHFARYRGGCNAIGSHTTRKSEFSHFRQIAAIAASQTGQSNNFSAGETRQTDAQVASASQAEVDSQAAAEWVSWFRLHFPTPLIVQGD